MTNNGGSNRNLGSSSVSQKDKGSANKRKLVDSSPQNPIVPPSTLTEFPQYESSLDKSQDPQSKLGHLEVGSTQLSDWDDPVDFELQELLLSNVLTIFQTAIKRLIDSGYGEDIAQKAISRLGIYRGGKDLVENILNDAVTYLKNEKDTISVRETFDNLQQMVEYTMLEMVNVLREVKPSLSTGEAIWWLLICDLNISQACAIKGDLLSEFSDKEIPRESPSDSTVSQSSSKAQSSETIPSFINEPNISNSPQFDAQSYLHETVKFGNIPNLSNIKNSFGLDGLTAEKESFLSMSGSFEKSLSISTSQIASSEGKSKIGRKSFTKKELAGWQKALSTDRVPRNHGKSISQSGKITSFGGFILEKRTKSQSESHGVQTKGSASNAKTKMQAKGSRHVTTNTPPVVSASDDTSKIHMKGTMFASGTANAELTASGKKPILKPEASTIVFPKISDYYAGIPYDEYLGEYVPQDEKDEFILKLVPRVQELQNDLQSWSEWANQKVMQATRRLSKDKPEFKALRLEKQEAELLKKEKKILEENTMKRLSEMEFALINATSQVETSNSSIQKLEAEHSRLKKEMEAAKLQATESAVSCQEALEREQKALKDAESWKGQKSLFYEQLETQKQKVVELQQAIGNAEKIQNQFVTRWKQERMLKEKWVAQAVSIKHEREQLEAATKVEEDMIRQTAENDVKKCKEDIKKLEKEISDLKSKSDASTIAALKRGIGGNYGATGNQIADINVKGSQDSNDFKEIVHLQETFGTRGLRRERECVMCLSEENLVVFVPCAHQVLCVNCNELHEKEGMKDCPSCRTPIQRRIPARFAHPRP